MYKNIISIYLAFFLLTSAISASALPYLEKGQTRLAFAQTYIGSGLEFIPSYSNVSYMDSSNALNSASVSSQLSPTFTIGGTHFWGHADFFVKIGLPSLVNNEAKQFKTVYGLATETGAKYYPWALDYNQLRPFLGISLMNLLYVQSHNDNDGPILSKTLYPITAGMSLMSDFGLFEVGGMYFLDRTFLYPINADTSVALKLPVYSLWAGYKYVFDTTIGITQDNNSSIKDSWFIGFGPSSSFQTMDSKYHQTTRTQFLGTDMGSFIPEFDLGYYFDDINIIVNLAYRPITSIRKSYGITQEAKRTYISLEAVQYLFDFYGFTPFFGFNVTQADLSFTESNDTTTIVSEKKSSLIPGITFGWDILPVSHPSWVLRTTLRYYPINHLDIDSNSNKRVEFDHLEFNFINLTLYIDRF